MKGLRKGLLSLLMIFLVLGIIVPMFLKINVEGMEPGNYPGSVTNPILSDTYHVKKNPGISTRSASDNYLLDFPSFPAGSCGTNNIKYWRRPDNGMCSPPNFCDGIYESTEQKISSEPQAPEGTPRVNYYVGKSN